MDKKETHFNLAIKNKDMGIDATYQVSKEKTEGGNHVKRSVDISHGDNSISIGYIDDEIISVPRYLVEDKR